jgi:hypothetical protein
MYGILLYIVYFIEHHFQQYFSYIGAVSFTGGSVYI